MNPPPRSIPAVFVLLLLAGLACRQPDTAPRHQQAQAPSPTDVEGVKRRLRQMVEADQDARRNGKSFAAIDRENTAELKRLFAQHGWIRISRFGAQADRHAWLLVQHADHDPVFQREVLAMLEPLARIGETSKRNFAYLYDRVAVNRGSSHPGIVELGKDGQPMGKQRYGTQGTCVGTKWEPFALEQPAAVDQLRAQVGLGPLEEYRTQFDCR